MSKIYWTHEERAALRDEMARLIVEGYRYNDNALLRDAQSALPRDRRRKIVGSVFGTLRPLIGEAKALAAERLREPRAAEPAAPAPAQPEPPTLAAMLATLVESLSEEIAQKVAAKLTLRQECKLPSPVQEQIAAAERPNRPGVLIVGLLDGQAAAVIQVFPELNITHLTVDEALKRPALHRAHVVLMTKFINHSVQEKYRAAPQLHYCNGGVSALTATLHDIIQLESAK